jgi:hypothetical protein
MHAVNNTISLNFEYYVVNINKLQYKLFKRYTNSSKYRHKREKESKRLTIYQIRGMICIAAAFFVACLLWKIDAMPQVLFKLHNCWKAQFEQLNKLHLHGLNLWSLYAIIQTLAWYYVLNFLSIAIVYILILAHDGLIWLILAMKVDVFFL